MLKKITAVLLCILMAFAVCSCGKDKKPTASREPTQSKTEDNNKSDSPTEEEKKYNEDFKTNVFYTGAPVAPGDIFTLPDIKAESGAPVLGEVTPHAKADDALTVMGEGFKGNDVKAFAYAQSTKDDGKTYPLSLTVTEDQTAAAVLDKSIPYGLFGIYFEKGGKKSNVLLVNQPKIWWIGITRLTAGEELKIFGENLTTDNGDRAYVYLIDPTGKYMRLDVNYADPYRVTAKIPDTLEENVAYTVMLHNGHGGDLGFATAKETVKYSKTPTTQFNGSRIDITKYGASPADDGGDDTKAIKSALAAAKNGDIVYFPAGTYNITECIEINKSVKLEGAGVGKSYLIMGANVEKSMFYTETVPAEVTGLEFWDVRKTKYKASFFYMEPLTEGSDTYNLYVHNCRFRQETLKKYNGSNSMLRVENASQVIVENNEFLGTLAIFTNYIEKLYFNNNKYTGTFYHSNSDLNKNATLIWGSNGFESYGNEFYVKDKPTDKPENLKNGEYAVARLYSLQRYNNSVYIANNKSINTGVTNENMGEQIMFETGNSCYDGPITSATATSITVPKELKPDYNNMATFTVVITSGKGMGQYRQTASYKAGGVSGGTLKFDEPLQIIPDSTSKVLITFNGSINTAVHNNDFNCILNANDETSATSGVQAYSNNFNFFITDNKFSNMTYGIQLAPKFNTASGELSYINNGLYWFIIDGNKMQNTGTGIRFDLRMNVTNKQYRVGLGITIRRNEFDSCPKYPKPRETYPGGVGISVGENYTSGNNGDWIHTTIIENNSFKGTATHDVYLYKYQNYTMLRNNTSSHGTVKTGNASGVNAVKNF